MYRKAKQKEIVKKEWVFTWVACDGKEFDNQNDCEEYERMLENQWFKKKEYLDSLIMEYDEIPMIDEAYSDNTYTYFMIPNKEAYEILKEICCVGKNHNLNVNCFPAIIVCENSSMYTFSQLLDPDDMSICADELYFYDLKTVMDKTTAFYKALGYNVTFEKNK